jgi:hypothetical protein
MLRWLLGSILAVLVTAVAGILINLATDQLKAWFPRLRLWAVRRQSRRMGPAAARYEEQWLADIEDTPGDLAKLWFVLMLFHVPLGTELERWRDSPQRIKSLAARAVLDRGWVLVVAGFTWICLEYPPTWSRLAAYAVMVPVIVVVALVLSSRARSALSSLYGETLNYFGRVSVAAMAPAVLVILLVCWGFVPGTGHWARKMRPARAGARPTVTFVTRPALITDDRITFQNDPVTLTQARYGAPNRSTVAVGTSGTRENMRLPGFEESPLSLTAAQQLAAPPFLPLEPLDPIWIPGEVLSQPIPPIVPGLLVGPPAAPTNLRIIR